MIFNENIRSKIDYIKDNLSEADILEQLAEEASELSHAALKLARIKRGTNPTPVTQSEAEENLIEEYTDIALVSTLIMKLEPDAVTMAKKIYRWYSRIKEVKGE